MLERIITFFKKEKFLTILLILYIIVTILTRGRTLNIVRYVDWNSIFTIMSILLVSKGLELSGLFTDVSLKLINISRGSPTRLIILIILVSALSATVLTNDVSLFIYVPIAIEISKKLNIDLAFLLTILAISVNIGSALTPIGNPQNIIIWQHYNINFTTFIVMLTPFFAISMITLLIYSLIFTRRNKNMTCTVSSPITEGISVNKKLLTISTILMIIDIALCEYKLSYLSLIITFLVYLTINRDIIFNLDYALVIMLILMFVDFRTISDFLSKYNMTILTSQKIFLFYLGILLSQVISNVPATIMLLNHTKDWITLAIATNLGGVGAVTGSLANIITLRLGKIRVKDFHRYSIPYFTLLLTIFTVLYLISYSLG